MSKNIEKLYDCKSNIKNLIDDIRAIPREGRFKALVVTKLEEAVHWLQDLCDEAYDDEVEKSAMDPSTTGVTAGHLNSGSAD